MSVGLLRTAPTKAEPTVAHATRRAGVNEAEDIVASGGIPLESGVLAEMEYRFRTDFSGVRVHTDPAAAQTARQLQARAYTVGAEIVFAPGRYSPNTDDGERLLAHELAHVVQQRGASLREPLQLTPQDGAAESQAGAMSRSAGGSGVKPGLSSTPRAIQRASEAEVPSVDVADADRAELAWLDSAGLNVVASQVIGENAWPFGREFFKGFGAAVLTQPAGRLKYIRGRFAELSSLTSHFADKWQFAHGYGIGLVEGLWLSLKGMVEGMFFLITLPFRMHQYLIDTLPGLVRTYGPRFQEFFSAGDALKRRLGDAFTEVANDPAAGIRSVDQLLRGLFQAGLKQARSLGGRAAAGVLQFLEQPWPQLGRNVGNVAGMVLFEALLLVLTSAIGNVVKSVGEVVGRVGARVVAEASSLLRRAASLTAEAADVIGRTAGRLGGRFAEMFQEFAAWLRQLRVPMQEAGSAAEIEAASARKIGPRALPDAPASRASNPAASGHTPGSSEAGQHPPVPRADAPFRGLAEAEIDAALETAHVPRTTGGTSAPRIEGRAVPTRRQPRLDVGSVQRQAGETVQAALTRIRRVIGRRVADIPELRAAWNRARARVVTGRTLAANNYEKLYDLTREQFWREVRNDPAALAHFSEAGFDLLGRPTTAPILRGIDPTIPITEARISLDHIAEKAIGNNWRLALDADNLRMEFSMPNTYREIIQARHPALR